MESEEKVFKENFDYEVVAMFISEAIRVIEGLFGPAFTRMISKYALEFQSEKTGENPPENIENMDGAVKYMTECKDKYPRFYNSLIYGIAKAEKMFEGSTASGAKNLAYNAIKKIIEESGIADQLKGKNINIYNALLDYVEAADIVKATTPQRIVKESENVIFQEMENCPWKDACKAMARDDITRMTGDKECVVLIANSAGISVVSGKSIDYKLEKFDQPNCEGRIFEI
ncbi:MAG: hypothetical protein ACETWM_11470 [Candidatus Lokiarchaeia archaeon]